MMACKYAFMGEDKVKRKKSPHGYSLQLSDAKERDQMVTVGDVWRLAVSGDTIFASPQLKLKDLCLSFALYKLLRRRFEEYYPSAEARSSESLDFLLCGMLGDDKDISPRDSRLPKEHKGERVFRVVEDEFSFLSDYYYSTIRVTLPNLWFFLLNCVLTLVILFFCCVDIPIYIVIQHYGVLGCLFNKQDCSQNMPTKYDLIITLLLIATLFLLEFAEAVAYMLSDWVMVSLLCTYVKKPSWQRSATVRWALTTLRRVKTCLKRPDLKFNQHSVLERRGCTLRIFSQLMLHHRFLKVRLMLLKPVLCRRFLGVQSTPIPKEVKEAIVKYLIENRGRCPALLIRDSVLGQNGAAGEELLQACKSNGAAETIIVWHVATCLYEMKHPSQQQPRQSDEHDTQANRRIAETLSKYCAYLVALAPELLPDDAAATTTAYKAAVKEIQKAILKLCDHKVDNFERVTSIKNANGTAAERGAELGHQLVAVRDERLVWKVLAERWTEIVVYIAPSDDVQSHAPLANGSEFITHIWALLTHGGILRWPTADENAPPPSAADQSPV
uniref:DUF4220 domain-containing protein n=1 Tax=Ananas comosus var. bracteatus TaxID=296719 RepID=A0A6V7PJD9_ANACO|nr:unnamed protein product [Ananas comosus var. bracteatus]